uniref:hypothetical protein n=1 Tax=Agathobacter sp. TaxID=2021311 RepID=UPI0040569F51
MNKKITSAITLILLSAFLVVSAKSVSNTKHITGDLKTGLGIITTVSKSTEADSEEDGSAASEILVAAVTVNEEGVIADCYIDMLAPSISFDANGVITTDTSAEFVSKQVLGDSYGMAGPSSIQKDWHAQVDAFAHYCIGLTAEEVLGISMNESGQAADKDLVAGCTMYIGNFQKVVAKAATNASEEGAHSEDLLGVNFVTSIANSTNATDTEDGLAQAYVTVAAVTLNEEKVITSTVFDAVQANVNFDATGKITSDISAEVASKNELGYSYNLKGPSSIQKEWFEQADAFAWHASGKTIEEVNATPLTEGVPSEGTDLVASVTIHVTDFIEALNKAVEIAE